MTAEQLKMARAAARLGVRELAEEAGVAPATITRLEGGRGGINMKSQNALRRVLEARGIQFLENGQVAEGAGVAVRAGAQQEQKPAEDGSITDRD